MPIRHLLAGAALCALATSNVLAADMSSGLVASKQSPWYVRVGGLAGFFNPSFTAGAPAPGSGLTASNAYTLGFDVGYFVTDNIAISLGAGIPPSVTTYGTGAIAGLGALGASTIAPAMLTAHYHFTNFGAFQPYFGGGLVYNIVLSNTSYGLANYNLQSSLGGVLQVGVDIYVNQNWGVYFDAKKLFLSSNVTSTAPAVNATVALDPWILTTGILYRF